MSTLVTKENKAGAGKPIFAVRQMLAGLELNSADDAVLRYLDFFTASVAVKALRVLHVIPRLELFRGLYDPGTVQGADMLGLNKNVLEEVENRVRMHPFYKHTKVLSDLSEGDPLERMLDEAEVLNADLLVIGQRTGAKDHGILAGNLVRKAKGNVLVVPESAAPQIDHIVVPIDFSPYSVKALEQALALRNALNHPVKITCLNVYELPNLNIYLVEKIEDVRRMLVDDRMAAFRNFLSRYAPGQSETIDTALIERDFESVATCVYGYAQREGASLILTGAKGHSQVERLLLGSVSESLLKLNDQIPVLVVR